VALTTQSSPSPRSKDISPRLALLLITAALCAGAALRADFLIASNFGIESDEAIVGLMAKHILRGDGIPVFYYGQPYMGSLEAICAAAMFMVFGQSNFSLQMTPFIFSIFHIALVAVLAQRVWSRRAGCISAWLTAISPAALTIWGCKARGGFIELVVLGTLALILAHSSLTEEKPKLKTTALLGFVLGISWWVNNQSIYYIASIGLVVGVSFLLRLRFKKVCEHCVCGALAFFLGGAPFWYFNIFETPRWQTFSRLGGSVSFGEAMKHFLGLVSESFPIIAGARRFWSDEDLYPGSSLISILLYVGTFLLAVLWAKSRSKSCGKIIREPIWLLTIFMFAVTAIFSFSSFGYLTTAPRYVLPMYSALFVLVACALESAWVEGGRAGKKSAAALMTCFLGFHLLSNYAGGRGIPGEPVIFKGERVAKDQRELYEWLGKEGYSHIKTNYWIGYRAAFETDERVTFTRFKEPFTLRIPEYEIVDPELRDEYAVYVLVPAQGIRFAKSLVDLGMSYRRTHVDGYQVFDHIQFRHPRKEIPLSSSQIESQMRQNWIPRLLDADSNTRWGSGMPQREGMEMSINLGEDAKRVSGLDIDYGFWPQDMPRRLIIEGKRKGQSDWCLLFDSHENYALDIAGRVWQIGFEPEYFSAIRLRQVGADSIFDWSMAGLRLYGLEEETVDGF